MNPPAFSVERRVNRKNYTLYALHSTLFLALPACTVFFLLTIGDPRSPVYACPLCADAIASQNDSALVARLTSGFGWSIALLMCTPYLLFAGLTLLIIRASRRFKKTMRD